MDAPGEKLLIRLWDTVENALGGFLNPWQARRTGRARADVRREELLTLAQVEQDVNDIRAGRKRFDADRQLVESSESDREASSPGNDPQEPPDRRVDDDWLLAEEIGRIEISRRELVDGVKGENITSIVHDASGALLDEVLDGLCIDVGRGRATIRWGRGFGDHFVPWSVPFEDVQFRAHDFCFRFVAE